MNFFGTGTFHFYASLDRVKVKYNQKAASSSPLHTVAYPGILFGGGSKNSVEDRGQREWGSGGGSPLVRGSGGSCNLAQEI